MACTWAKNKVLKNNYWFTQRNVNKHFLADSLLWRAKLCPMSANLEVKLTSHLAQIWWATKIKINKLKKCLQKKCNWTDAYPNAHFRSVSSWRICWKRILRRWDKRQIRHLKHNYFGEYALYWELHRYVLNAHVDALCEGDGQNSAFPESVFHKRDILLDCQFHFA